MWDGGKEKKRKEDPHLIPLVMDPPHATEEKKKAAGRADGNCLFKRKKGKGDRRTRGDFPAYGEEKK